MKKLFLSNAALKIIAIITMTIDHVGYFLMMRYSAGNPAFIVGNVFRDIGRIAFPLFCFMAFEGATKSKNVWKYISRLGFIGAIILIAQIILEFGVNYRAYQGNIFLDLILGVLAVHLLENDKKWVKFTAIIPLGIGVISYFLYCYEASHNFVYQVWWFPYFLRPQYDFHGILLIMMFYFNKKVLLPLLFKNRNLDYESTKNEPGTLMIENILHCTSIVALFLLQYSIKFWAPGFAYWIEELQVCAVFAAIPLFFYNHMRGYNKKWFNYTCYFYYPVHIAIIYLIFTII